jgi:pyruvate dehydrogenase (quinone)
VQDRAAEEVAGADGLIHPQYLTRLIDRHAADEDAFTADSGSPMVWLLWHARGNGKRRPLTGLVHGTMANAMPEELGIQQAFPGRRVISLSGDGALAMLLGDLATAVQENLPIKVIVCNNGSHGVVEMKQKVEGVLDTCTDLTNPDFARVAEAMGFHGRRVERAAELDEAVRDVLSRPGPARRQGQSP